LRIANEKGETFFVWYHNTYSIQRFASRLYFIHKEKMISPPKEIMIPTQWTSHENVTTCVLEIETYENDLMNLIVSETIQNNEKMKTNINTIWEETNTDEEMNTILYNLNRNFDSKIVSMGQSIQMNDYETTMHDKLLYYIYIILFFVFFVFVFVLTYYYYVSRGTVWFFRS
jgi:ABC-type multidrug transport system ATPase subunit